MVTERVTGHPVRRAVDDLITVTQSALEQPQLSPTGRDHLRRVLQVAEHVRATLNRTRSTLVPVAALDNANPHVAQASAAIQAFLNDQNDGYLATANDHIDQALIQIRSLPPAPFRVQEQAMVEAADGYLARVAESYARLLDQLDVQSRAFSEAVTRATETLQTISQNASTRLDELRQAADQNAAAINKEAEDRIAELRTEVTSQKARLDDAVAQQQTAFAAAQEKRLEESNQTLRRLETEFKTASDALIATVTATHDELVNQAKELTASLEDKDSRAAQVLGFSAAANVARAYLQEAAEQKREADNWRRFAFGMVFVLTVAALVISAFFPPSGDFTTSDYLRYAITKLPIFIALGPAIPLAMRQSAHHRRRETAARRRGQELTSFRPFLAELKEEERKQLIKDAAPRYFKGDDLALLDSQDA